MGKNSFLAVLLSLALLTTGCTKSREAELPAALQSSVFAIAEFGDIQTENSPYSVTTDESLSSLSLGNSSKATAEKGVVALAEVKVPDRLKYMFSGLTITGLTARDYAVTFSVDKQFVTAYKVVTSPAELSILEKQLAQVQEEVVLQKQLQKSKDKAKSKELLASLQKARAKKQTLLRQSAAPLLVPIFKFKVARFGVVQREKNRLKEDTSTLELVDTDWANATHIQIGATIENRLAIGLDPAQSGDLDRTFVMDRINNKIMTAETLRNEYQIPLNLDNGTRVLTLLDTTALHVFEITQFDKAKDTLSDSQLRELQVGAHSNVRACPAEVVKALPTEAQKGCLLVLRYDVDVTYVKPEQGTVDYDGNLDAKVDFKPVVSSQNIGLVQVPKDVIPKTVEAGNTLDPRSTIRIADIKDKEFFFKRTLEDASYAVDSIGLAPGMSGKITIVKFELQEERVVIRRADKFVNYKTSSNDADYEELMSLPVKYVKLETKDASGSPYAIPRVVPATRKDAQYMNLDWTANSIPQSYSPYAPIYEGCILGIADTQVADVDMRLDKGVLNFSQKYSLALRPECFSFISPKNSKNGNPTFQSNARVTERISFKLNDGSTDKSFVTPVPFKVQKALGYGVWTIGQINPDDNGQFGREGTETNLPMVHDFRNGKILTYTLTGLPNDDPEMRKLYIGIAQELAASWNLAYKQAFKGSVLERSGDYIELQIAGENGVTAHLGDLDKNIFHFENKFSSHGILGVSQVGFNPRSAIVVADSLILYSGNVKSDVAQNYQQMKVRTQWNETKECILKKARTELASGEVSQEKCKIPGASGQIPENPMEEKIAATASLAQDLTNKSQKLKVSRKMDLREMQRASTSGLKSNSFKTALKSKLDSGGGGHFAYSAPKDESGWIDRVFETLMTNPNMNVSEIYGSIAKEVLASRGNKLSETDELNLSKVIKQSTLKAKMLASLKRSPGCMKTVAEITNANYGKMNFIDAFRIEALNTMVHEMGHSQGLTHNFIGSFDKVNYANEDGTPSKRNYSSVMDYLTPGKFNWDGLGSYDIRAMRASHLGLFEVTPEYKASLGSDASKFLVNDKYISIQNIQASVAKEGWANFSKADLGNMLKKYKFCTDGDVGFDPTCQRHDFGSSVTEVVESLVNDWEDNYVANYHSWNRNSFSWAEGLAGPAMSKQLLWRMRMFMDEAYYKVIYDRGSEEELKDYVNGAVKVYFFYNQLINTPDATLPFLNPDRLVAVPYKKKELNEKKEPTGKEIQEVAIVEKRALTDIRRDENRIDTVGLEFDKIAAMRLLTMRGFPNRRYTDRNMEFSFLDFEEGFLGMTSDDSFFVNTVVEIMLNRLVPTFTTEDGGIRSLSGMPATITPALKQRAAVYGILNLEAPTLKDKNNFANLFKVGSSVGKGPSDRIALGKLGVSETSAARLSFWSLDNADAAQKILKTAADKNFFIKKISELQPLMEKLISLQLQEELSKSASADKKTAEAKIAAEVSKAQKGLIAKLNALNANGDLITAEKVKENPELAVEKQVEGLMSFNSQMIVLSVAMLMEKESIKPELVENVSNSAQQYADASPLAALDQKFLVSALADTGKSLSQEKGNEKFAELGQAIGQLVNASALENSYGIIMRNIEFLNSLTSMTNPEYSR